MAAYVRGFIALFLLLTVLLHLPPGKSYQKYIRFFAELILTIALLTPVLSIVCDSEEFSKLVDYEEFTEELEELSKDMQHMEYLYGDYHKATYEEAIAEDVKRIAEEYGFFVQEVSVQLSDEYTVDHISLRVTEDENEQIVIERIVLEQTARDENGNIICSKLRQELMEFYQLDESKIEVQYGNGQEGEI